MTRSEPWTVNGDGGRASGTNIILTTRAEAVRNHTHGSIRMKHIGDGPIPLVLANLAAELEALNWGVTMEHRFSYLVMERQYCSGVEMVATDPQSEHQLYLDYIRPQGQQRWALRTASMSDHPPIPGRFGRIRRVKDVRHLAESPLQARRDWLAARATVDPPPTRRQFLQARIHHDKGET